MRKTKTSYSKSRYRTFLWLMIQKYQPLCPICKQPITDDDLPTRGTDSLTEHHVSGVHEDNRLENRVIVHRRCQKSYHAKDNINSMSRNFWRQFNDKQE